MSLLDLVSNIQKKVVFDPRFTGIKAKYSRRKENRDGDLIKDKHVILDISPQGNYVVTDKKQESIGGRLNIIWAKTEDLQFDGEPFLPEENDMIEYKVGGVLQRFRVAKNVDMKTPSSLNQRSTFAYEDGLHSIIKINTLRQE